MFIRWSWAAVLLLLSPGEGWAQENVDPEDFDATIRRLEETIATESLGEDEERESQPEEEASSPVTSDSTPPWTNLLRMEAATLTLLPRRGGGQR